jgi:general secretion pathway protein G
MKTKSRPYRRQAFTLIELLTVIAIIGILAAILIPVVGRVRDSARNVQCISNIRECGNAIQIMLSESDHQLRTFGSGAGNAGVPRWPQQVANLGIVGREVFYCPNGETGIVDIYNAGTWDWRVGYGLNMIPGGFGSSQRVFGAGADQYVMNFNLIEDPTRYILLADSADGNGISRFRLDRATVGGSGSIHLRHQNRANIYFLDGHAESAGPARLGELGLTSGYGEIVPEAVNFPQPSN